MLRGLEKFKKGFENRYGTIGKEGVIIGFDREID